MEIMGNSYLPGDPRLIDHIVYELKAQGIFDQFRKECISDVDTKPAYQNLRQRVEGNVTSFLKTQKWNPDMNKNHVREMLRKNISESGYLETGVERIVDQVVNPKINTIFLPQVENVVYKYLGIEKPSNRNENQGNDISKPLKINVTANDLLPNDLEAISPESETMEKSDEKANDLSFESEKGEEKMEEDESPPFEPIEGNPSQVIHDENSVDSHLSGISGLASHDSNHSADRFKMDISNQDSQLSKQSSGDGHLSIDSDKMDISEESSQSRSKTNETEKIDANSSSFSLNIIKSEEKIEVNENVQLTESTELDNLKKDEEIKTEMNIENEEMKNDDKTDKKHKERKDSERKHENGKSKTDEKKHDRHRSSEKHKSRQEKYSEKEKDRKDKDKKDKEKSSSKDSKDRKSERDKSKSDRDESKERSKTDKDKSKSEKDRNKDDKEQVKTEKEKDKSKHDKDKRDKDKGDREKTEKEKYDKEKSKSERHKDKSKSDRSRNEKDKSKDEKEKKDRSKENRDRAKDKSNDKRDKPSDTKHKSEEAKDKHLNGKHKSSCSSSKDNEEKGKKKNKENKSENGSANSDSKHKVKSESKSSEESVKKEKDDKYSKKEEKGSHNDKHRKEDKHDKNKKDSKRDFKKSSSKDDHYSSKGKKWDRRSTDRDSSDGRSGNQSSQSSDTSQIQRRVQESSISNSGSGSGDSGNSDGVESSQESEVLKDQFLNANIDFKENLQSEMHVKLIKPKFASNIFEAKRLMKIRKQLHELERQSRINYINNKEIVNNCIKEAVKDSVVNTDNKNFYENVSKNQPANKKRPVILKETSDENKIDDLSVNHEESALVGDKIETLENNLEESNEATDKMEKESTSEFVPPPLANQVITKESWDALEAKLSQQNLLNTDYGSYGEYSDSDSPLKKEDYDRYAQSFSKSLSEMYESKEQMQHERNGNLKSDEQSSTKINKHDEEPVIHDTEDLEKNTRLDESKMSSESESTTASTVEFHNEQKVMEVTEECNETVDGNLQREDKLHKDLDKENLESVEKESVELSTRILETGDETIVEKGPGSELNNVPKKVSDKSLVLLHQESSKEFEEETPEFSSAEVKASEDLPYFNSSSVAESRDHLMCTNQVIEELEQEISFITTLLNQRQKISETHAETLVNRNVLSDSNKVVNSKSNKAFVDTTRNNQTSTPVTKRGRKRKIINEDKCDVHNNNKINNHIANVDGGPSPHQNDTSQKSNVSKVSPNTRVQVKRAKNEDDAGVISTDEKFNLPLSPSESENSFSSDKKDLELSKSSKRKISTERGSSKLQRYSSDDLYKPRLNFSSKRRSAKLVDND